MKQIFFALILVFGFGFSIFAQNENSNCPKIEVTGGGQVRPGEMMSFTANVTGGLKKANLEYEWTISAGTISSGQGTSSITVDTSGTPNGISITAEVKIKGLFDNCPNTASETGSLISCGLPTIIDEFGNIPRDEIKVRIDFLFERLKNEMNGQLYIINYGTEKEIAAREKLIRDYIALRKYDSYRVTMVRGGENPSGETGVWSRFYIVPLGMEAPEP
jgi:hypothetical protein